jgi:hypothetical protein
MSMIINEMDALIEINNTLKEIAKILKEKKK